VFSRARRTKALFDTLTLSALPPEDEALRPGVRNFLSAELNGLAPHVRARSWMGTDVGFSKKLGKAGFLGLTLPTQYGGGGKGPFARFVIVEELLAAGAPVAAHWIADRQSAPLINRFGTEEQREFYLPPICRGESFYAIGMSEPGAGSDLAAVRTTATRTDKGWLINGQKIWTSGAHHCHYMITLLRTSGTSADRHAGLSQINIDLKAPGVTIRPIKDITGDSHFNEIFFDNVELPANALIGEEGAGWNQVVAELAYERCGPERIYSSIVLVDAWINHVRGRDRMKGSTAQLAGNLIAQLATLRSLSVAVTARLVAGESPVVEASLFKDLGTSFEQAIPALIGADLGSHPDEYIDPELYRTLQLVTNLSPSFSLRGGTREILRGIIARGLGLR
jgi:alkylation response protein AidB-like acyl-CoA dehydrogenase